MPEPDPTPDARIFPQEGRAAEARRMPRFAILWLIGAALLLLALAATIGSVDRDVYSARGVVTGYLQALSARDASAALAIPGVRMSTEQRRSAGLSPTASSELLRNDVLAPLRDVVVTADRQQPDGAHLVTVRYTIGTLSGAEVGTSTFTVRPSVRVLGVFQTWEFSVSPLAETKLTVLHGSLFSAGGETLDTRASNPGQRASAFTTHAEYLTFAPSLGDYSFASPMLKAAPVYDLVTKPLSINSATVDVQPTATFVARVNAQSRTMLAACTRQKVLMPTGCPFGAEIDNRVVGAPTWTMVSYPVAQVVAGAGAWEIPPTKGTAHLDVQVQSLFDGSTSTQSTTLPFTESASDLVIDNHGRPEFDFDS